MFLFGLVNFLLGQISYISAFFSVSQASQWSWIGLFTSSIISG